MQCNSPCKLKNGILVPCGKCSGCKIARSREWALRCMHELTTQKGKAIFVTLTYEDDKLPYPTDKESTLNILPTLRKKHLQLFFKRLRKEVSKYKGGKIRYFACGEYGPTTLRPHYHMIIFGLDNNINNQNLIVKCWDYCDWSNYSIRKKSFGSVTYESCRYVARYIDSKVYGDYALHFYNKFGKVPPFLLCSQKIGLDFAAQNLYYYQRTLHDVWNGEILSIPRYYRKKFVDELPSTLFKDMANKQMRSEHEYFADAFPNLIDDANLCLNPLRGVHFMFEGVAQKSREQKERTLIAKHKLFGKKEI